MNDIFEMNNFLGVYPLRVGAVTATFLYYFYSLCAFAPAFWLIFVLGDDYEVVEDGETGLEIRPIVGGKLSPGADTARTFGLWLLPIGTVFLIGAVLLHLGVVLGSAIYVKAWLIVNMTLFGYATFYDIVKLITTKRIEWFNLTLDAVMVYLWVVMLNFYWLLKEIEEGG